MEDAGIAGSCNWRSDVTVCVCVCVCVGNEEQRSVSYLDLVLSDRLHVLALVS